MLIIDEVHAILTGSYRQIYDLRQHQDDPFDSMIIAQALAQACAVVSSDQRFPLYQTAGLKVIWE